jgi:hypothetical protein
MDKDELVNAIKRANDKKTRKSRSGAPASKDFSRW